MDGVQRALNEQRKQKSEKEPPHGQLQSLMKTDRVMAETCSGIQALQRQG